MNALVLGARGLIGQHVVAELSRKGVEVFARDIEDGDIATAAGCDVPNGTCLVVNCAGYTDVDGAEQAPQEAVAANTLGAWHVARAAAQVGALCVHISTDFVFGQGGGLGYGEDDAPYPREVYAGSKAAGEMLALSAGAVVLRTGGVYGEGGRNFSSNVARRLLAGETVMLDMERICTPTPALVVARLVLELAARARPGVYHGTCIGSTTWFDWGLRLATLLGADRVQVIGAITERLQHVAHRPSLLLHHYSFGEDGVHIPSWRDALDEYAAEVQRAR